METSLGNSPNNFNHPNPMNSVTSNSTSAARAKLNQQRRISTVVSLITAILMLVLIGLILAIILFHIEKDETPAIVSYSAPADEIEEVKKPTHKTEVSRKPSAPSASMSLVIASTTSSPVAVPVPEFEVPDASVDFGNGEDFGDGWSTGDSFGSGGGGTTFFGQKVSAERIAYVIDFSASMKGQNRQGLMRDELCESLDKMNPGLDLGMIFFAGPAWVAGDTVKGGVVTSGRKEYKWARNGNGHSKWEHDGKKQPVPWEEMTPLRIKKLKKIVQETKLIGGTVWDNPLNMALDMDPPPQMIYFMTDGAAQGSDIWAKEVAKRAKEMGVTVNCVAMMVPKAIKDLKHLAFETGGQMTIVTEGGKREQIEK